MAVMNKISLVIGVSAVALMLGTNVASAQVLDVTQKPRPEFDPIGVPVGSFILFPKITAHETYDSNIYAQSNNRTDDWVTNIRPSLSLDSDWNNHALSIKADGDWGIYNDNSDEDYFDYGVSGNGRVDVRRTFNIFGGAGYRHMHEDRGSPNAAVGSTEPTELDRVLANAGFEWKPNRFGVIGEYRFTDLDFDDTVNSLGVVNNNDDRDRQMNEGRLRLSYDFSPGYALFVEGIYNKREYDNTPDDAGVNRNSDGYKLNGGVEFDITGTVVGEVFAGYFEQDYESAALSNSSGLNYGADVLWSVTELTSVNATLTQNVRETTTAGASSFVATSAVVGVDHELMRNVLVGGSVGFTRNAYDGINRDDDILRLRAYGKYFITRNFFAGADASYLDRDSNVAGIPYTRYKLGAFVGAQF